MPHLQAEHFTQGNGIEKAKELPEILVYRRGETGNKNFRALSLTGCTSLLPYPDTPIYDLLLLLKMSRIHSWPDPMRTEAEVCMTSSKIFLCTVTQG